MKNQERQQGGTIPAPLTTDSCGGTAVQDTGQHTPIRQQASESRVRYRIENMDCPVEERLIRKKLEAIPGIVQLEFNLVQRVLTVDHALPSADLIEEALRSINMIPEALGGQLDELATFFVQGMDCPVEERLIRSTLETMDGVLAIECNILQRIVKVRHIPSALPDIAQALESLQLGATLQQEKGAAVSAESSAIPWKSLAIAGVFAAFSEAVELIHAWSAQPFGIDMASWQLMGFPLLELLSFLFALVAIYLGGLTTYKKGWLSISHRELNINALMSIAVTGAVLIGQFPEAAMVMVLFNLSEAIEAKALDRARHAIKNLLALAPEKATMQRKDGSWEEVDIRQIAVGTLLRVRPGERIALDGIVRQGRSSVNQAPITGESLPVEKGPGDMVYAGTVNEAGSFEFEVTATANDSTLARIIHAVEEAQGRRAPMQRFVDKFAQYYTPAVLLLALLAALVPPLVTETGWLSSIYTALVLLVIGCPCALVISTPVSIVGGMAAATRYGILIKGGMFLELGRKLRWLALDKTGTLTHGKPVQTDAIAVDDNDPDSCLSIAASLASRSDHPVSRAIVDAAATQKIALHEIQNFIAVPGQGITGTVLGRRWSLGNSRMAEVHAAQLAELHSRIASLENEGKTVVVLFSECGIAALFAVADTLKESSIEAIQELRRMGISTVMLTGDNRHAAENIAAQVGVDEFQSELLPEDKLRSVEELKKRGGIVGMVGDGINDAPALAEASIGFAMAAGGTDTAIETADVAIMDDDLCKIARFVSLSRGTYAILVQNIALAISVKFLFFALTFAGYATMWMAVFADVGTALLVVANGLRAMRQ